MKFVGYTLGHDRIFCVFVHASVLRHGVTVSTPATGQGRRTYVLRSWLHS